jgi:hypothetical protein
MVSSAVVPCCLMRPNLFDVASSVERRTRPLRDQEDVSKPLLRLAVCEDMCYPGPRILGHQ